LSRWSQVRERETLLAFLILAAIIVAFLVSAKTL